MPMPDSRIADFLQNCETDAPYGDSRIDISSDGAEIIVISDLHMGPGKSYDGCYSATENFFADAAFCRFIDRLLERPSAPPAILVINGDMVDFLRTTGFPRTRQQLSAWKELLEKVGISMTVEGLHASISKKERKFGLGTEDYKSIWKLDRIVRGHQDFYNALAKWLAHGHRLVVVKGNHDLEWYWRAVRNFLRLVLAEKIVGEQGQAEDDQLYRALVHNVCPRLLFIDDSLVIDKIFYIEHGHRYDKYTWVLGGPLLADKTQLNIPFGSFFNRYLLNRVELAFPYTDNVRPSTNLLPLLIRERFFVAMKLLFHHLPFMLRIIPKRYYRYIFGKVAVLALAVALPLLLATMFFLSAFPQFHDIVNWLPHAINGPGSSFVKAFLSLAGSYFLSRFVAHFQLSEPSTLKNDARLIMVDHPEYQFVTMGHTHNPDQFRQRNQYFFNTGTWIPIIEISTAEVREDKTYILLYLRRTASGDLQPTWLQRWDDEAGRMEDLIIRTQK